MEPEDMDRERPWWQLPIRRDREDLAGRWMVRATALWFVALVVLALIIGGILVLT